ncbi:MAG TPA: hypothetical protein VGJ84_13680 [Polyangiaceae bacterium]
MSSRFVYLDNGEGRAWIYPEQGFQLFGFEAKRRDGRPVQVVFGPAGPHESADRRYGNPILFPSPGVSNGSQPNSWDYRGRALPMPQHGWARNVYWSVEEITEHSITAFLTPNSGFRSGFPFDFELQLRYTLEGRTLSLDVTLNNHSSDPFPYALGFHPYLRTPLGEAGQRAACTVKLPSGTLLRSEDGWRTVIRSEAAARVLEAATPGLDGSIVLTETHARELEVEDHSSGLAARVSVEGSEHSFPVWVIWSPAPGAPYLCVEPWTDAPNALNRPNTRSLAAGEAHCYRMSLSLREL